MTVKIGPERLGRFERALVRLMPGSVHRGMQRGGRLILQRLRMETAAKKIQDTGAFAQGWAMAFSSLYELSIFNWAPWAIYVERGRGPGKRPPIQPLRAWSQRRLGNANLAFAVANAIAKRGIKPRPVMYAAGMAEEMAEIMTNSIREATWATVKESIGL